MDYEWTDHLCSQCRQEEDYMKDENDKSNALVLINHAASVRRLVESLSAMDRVDFFSLIEDGYCTSCGNKEKLGQRCQCTNDE